MRTSWEDFLPSAARSVAIAETHILSEYAEIVDLDALMTTVSANPRYVIGGAGSIDAISDRVGVRQYYARQFLPLAWRPRTQIVSDWYLFHEGVGTRQQRSSAEQYSLSNCVLLPVVDDGIVGEWSWARQSPAGAIRSDDSTSLPEKTLLNLSLHEEIVQAMQVGETSKIAANMSKKFVLARNYGSDVSSVQPMIMATSKQDALRHFKAGDSNLGSTTVSVIQRQVTDWYIFAECLVTSHGNPDWNERRMATIYGIDEEGKLESELSYCADGVAPRGPALGTGRAIYKRRDYTDNLVESRQ